MRRQQILFINFYFFEYSILVFLENFEDDSLFFRTSIDLTQY